MIFLSLENFVQIFDRKVCQDVGLIAVHPSGIFIVVLIVEAVERRVDDLESVPVLESGAVVFWRAVGLMRPVVRVIADRGRSLVPYDTTMPFSKVRRAIPGVLQDGGAAR